MAQYKVPQDVEADDKLLGPFNFRQFVYLMIAGGLIALAVGLFQLFPLLAIIPLPPVVLLVALALPLKRDQPMETYLAAVVTYYLKPHSRVWKPGQRESTVTITAPKKVEENRTRDITGEEATHRLSFLADIVDTEGYAIKGVSSNPMREDLVAEAQTAVDIFEGPRFDSLATTIRKDETERHAEVMKHMQESIEAVENPVPVASPTIVGHSPTPTIRKKSSLSAFESLSEAGANGADMGGSLQEAEAPLAQIVTTTKAKEASEEAEAALAEEAVEAGAANTTEPSTESNQKTPSSVIVMPDSEDVEKPVENSKHDHAKSTKKSPTKQPKASIIELANNDVFSVATIAEQAERINKKEKGEVFISLH